MEKNKAKPNKKAIILKIALVLAVVALTGAIAFYFSIPSVPDVSGSGIQALRLDLKGRAFAREKKYDQAIALYGQALTILPGDYNVLMDRGQAYYNKKDYQAALGDYQSALENSGKIDPNVAPGVSALTCSTNAMFGVALCQSALEEPEKAVKMLHQLQAKDGHFIKSYQVLGDIYLRNNDTLSAIDAYTQGLRLNPDAASLHFDRSLAYLNRDMNQQAFDDLSRAAVLDKDSLPVYLKHANLANKMGKLEIADNDAKEILRLEPGNRSAVAWLKKRKIDFDLPQPEPDKAADTKAGEAEENSGENTAASDDKGQSAAAPRSRDGKAESATTAPGGIARSDREAGQKSEQKPDQKKGVTEKALGGQKPNEQMPKDGQLKPGVAVLDNGPATTAKPLKTPNKIEPIKVAPSNDPGLPRDKKEENAFY